MAIYTKKGDKGTTKVFDKKSGTLVGISKKSCKIRSIGAIDELNSFLGIVRSEIGSGKLEIGNKNINEYENKIQEIQGDLFTINSMLAGSNLELSNSRIKALERDIDDWEGTLPVQKNFIFYGGSLASSQIFYARALCRRAERTLVKLEIGNKRSLASFAGWKLEILAYINRLSDYLFMMGRAINFEMRVKEEYWIGSKDK